MKFTQSLAHKYIMLNCMVESLNTNNHNVIYIVFLKSFHNYLYFTSKCIYMVYYCMYFSSKKKKSHISHENKYTKMY